MLPFDQRPWAKPIAATAIGVTVIGAILAPFYLRHIQHLDPPMVVLIVLLVLAIVPPNYVILRPRKSHRRSEGYRRPHPPYAARPMR